MDGARIRVVLPIPRYDNLGRRFRARHWLRWEAHLRGVSGGFTRLQGTAIGVWVSPDATSFVDRSRIHLLALRSWQQLGAWLRVVEFARQLFEQEAMYTEIARVPEILPPA